MTEASDLPYSIEHAALPLSIAGGFLILSIAGYVAAHVWGERAARRLPPVGRFARWRTRLQNDLRREDIESTAQGIKTFCGILGALSIVVFVVFGLPYFALWIAQVPALFDTLLPTSD